MGMKHRRCNVCSKSKRFDADHWIEEGWTALYEPDSNGNLPPPTERPKACPACSGSAALIAHLKRTFALPVGEVKVFVDADCVYPNCKRLVACLDTFRCWEHLPPLRQAELRAAAGLPSKDRP